jgi:hypothetical protein
MMGVISLAGGFLAGSIPWLRLVKWGAFALIVAGAYAAGDLRRARLDKLEADAERGRQAAQALEASEEARRIEQKRASGVQEAQDHAQAIARVSRADAAAARTELQRLRDILAERDRIVAVAAGAQCRVYAGATERKLLQSCAEALAGLGEEADRERAHLIELQGYVKAIRP